MSDLSPRQLQILQAIVHGESSDEAIGRTLGISTNTVRNHLAAARRKVGASDRTQAVLIGLRAGWLTLDG